jgi:uncharacterized protein
MEINLKKTPQNVTIIEGFPGFGLVGTISTEYLLDHLDAEKIGSIWFDGMNPIVAVHEKKVVEPIGIFYHKKKNLVIIHALTNVSGVEWKLAKIMDDLAKKLKAKEFISLEGVGALGKGGALNMNKKFSPKERGNLEAGGPKTYYYSSKKNLAWEKAGIPPLNEGMVIGVTASMLLKLKSSPISCIFVEAQSGLPDSRAAAEIIKVLDLYLGLKVDFKPLLKKAENFEGKIKGLMKNTQKVIKTKDNKELSYMG